MLEGRKNSGSKDASFVDVLRESIFTPSPRCKIMSGNENTIVKKGAESCSVFHFYLNAR